MSFSPACYSRWNSPKYFLSCKFFLTFQIHNIIRIFLEKIQRLVFYFCMLFLIWIKVCTQKRSLYNFFRERLLTIILNWDPKFAIHGLVVRCPKENIREKSDHWWIGDRFKIRSWSADHFTAIFPMIFFLTSTQRGYYKIHEKLRYFFATMYLRSLLWEIQNHDLDLISDHKKKNDLAVL